MGAGAAWFTAVVLLLSLVVVLHQMGYDVAPSVGAMLRGVEHMLGQPL